MTAYYPIWAATNIGLTRPINEDNWSTSERRGGGSNENWQGTINQSGGWAIVADGMGGHGAGDVASDLVVDALSKLLPFVQSQSTLGSAIEQANEQLYEAMYSKTGHPAMGTTIVGAIFDGQSCTFFNVGDSRAYLLREGSLRRLSRDHTPEGGQTNDYRSHALTQSLGGTVARFKLIPHVVKADLCPGDVVLLCSDGLTDMVSDSRIEAILSRPSQHPAADLVNAALNEGGRDNVTVIVLTA